MTGGGLAGSGALAIWHDIAPEGRDTFYAWHGSEHMPERLGIPGVLRGRRYIGIQASLEFFNLYETTDIGVLRGPDYAARVNNPTPWTLEAVRHFRAVARSICGVEYSSSNGNSQGGLIATLRYDVADAHTDAHRQALRDRALPALAQAPGIAGVHLLSADDKASGAQNAEQRARATANAVPRWILLVEGWGDEAPFMERLRDFCAAPKLLALHAVDPFALDFYRLQTTVTPAMD